MITGSCKSVRYPVSALLSDGTWSVANVARRAASAAVKPSAQPRNSRRVTRDALLDAGPYAGCVMSTPVANATPCVGRRPSPPRPDTQSYESVVRTNVVRKDGGIKEAMVLGPGQVVCVKTHRQILVDVVAE